MTSSNVSENWLRFAIDRIPKPIFFIHLAEQRVWFSNRAAKDMLGMAYEEEWDVRNANPTLRLLTPDGVEVAFDQVPSRRAIRGETLNGEEFIIESSQGRFFVRVFVEQLPAAYGHDASAVVLVQDVSALKEASKKIEQSHQIAQLERAKYEDVLKQITVPIVLYEGPEHVITFASQAVYEIFETPASIVGQTLEQVFPESIEQGFKALFDHVFTTGETVTAREARFDRRSANGSVKTFYLDYTFAAKRNVKGEIEGVLNVAVDVTRHVELRRQVEISNQKLANERYLLDQVFKHSPAAMATWVGDDLIFDQINPEYQKIFPGRELLGKPIGEAVPELNNQGYIELLRNVLHTGKPYVGKEERVKIQPAPGLPLEDRYYSFAYVQLKDVDQKPYAVYDHAIDVTNQVLARQEAELARSQAELANRAKSQFLANMSHEIRTPLGAIMGFTSLLKDASIDPAQIADFVSVIERNSSQLLRLVDDILDLSKVEAGRLSIEEIDFSLTDLLTDLSSIMSLRAREKGIQYRLRALTPLPRIVRTDPTRLRQILTNVVGNAIKFTDQGSVELRCSFANARLQFEVEDSGRGISADEAAQLFQPFAQADSSITRKYGGTGLGLVLTRSLAEALGGEFKLRSSELGRGSVFDVSVTASVRDGVEFVKDVGLEGAPPRSEQRPAELAGTRVLLVEDAPDNQAMMTIFLGRAGAVTDVASDGAQGLEMAFNSNYDVILMDLQMPVMDGLTAIRRLRERGYKGVVIALTAHAMKEERERCLAAGFDDFLSKPIPRNELVAKVREYAR